MVARAGKEQQYTVSGIARFGGFDLARRRDDRGLRPAHRPGALQQGGPARPDLRRREAGRVVVRAREPDRVGAAAAHAGADRRAAGEGADRRDRLAARVPALLPARVRRHRALRRRVRDRQHALDHDRPADARVRHAPDGRCLALAGALDRRPRGPDDGDPGVGRRPVRRLRPREGPRRALQGVRRRPAADRPRLRHAHRDRLDRPRHRRDPARRAAARLPRDGRAADRRGARGIGPAALAPRAASARSSRSASAWSSLVLVGFGAFGSIGSTGVRLLLLAVGVLGGVRRGRDGRADARPARSPPCSDGLPPRSAASPATSHARTRCATRAAPRRRLRR